MDFNITERELEVIKLIAQGFNNKQVGEKLFIAERTVQRHLAIMAEKLKSKYPVDNRTQIVIALFKEGLLNLNDIMGEKSEKI